MSGDKISDMTITVSLPDGCFAPIVVTDVATGLNPALNYRYDIGTRLNDTDAAIALRPTSAILAASGGAALIGSANGDTVQENLTALANLNGAEELPAPYYRTPFTIPSTVRAFGDSFFEQPNSHTSSTDSMAQIFIADLLGKTPDITATSGWTSADGGDAVFGLSVGSNDFILIEFGQNDANHIDAASVTSFLKYADLASIVLALHAQSAIEDGDRKVNADDMTAAGSWSADTDFPEGTALVSTTQNAALQTTIEDTRYVVVIYKLEENSGGLFQVTINGTPYLGQTGYGFATKPFSNEINTNTGLTYARGALVFDLQRITPNATVQILVKSATNASNTVGILKIIGFSGEPLHGPLLGILDTSDRGALGYATATGSKDAVPIVSRLHMQAAACVAAMGGRVVAMPLSSTLNPDASPPQLDTDEFHPNQLGAELSAQMMLERTEAAIDFSAYRTDLFAQSMVTGADGYLMYPGAPLLLDGDMRWKRRKIGANAMYFQDGDNILLQSAGVYLTPVSNAGVALTSKSLLLTGDGTNSYVQDRGGQLVLGANGANAARVTTTDFRPETDNVQTLGTDSVKWQYVSLGTAGVRVSGTKVVGAQGAAVADASGGATVDTEARAAINTLLARLRTHGLIAT